MNYRPVTIFLSLLAAALLLAGIPVGLAYDYYIFLRWAIMAIAVFISYRSFDNDNQGWAWIMIALAVVFNPIAPLGFSKGTWVIIDFAAIAIFIASSFIVKEKHEKG